MKTTWRVLAALLFVCMMITGFVFGQVPQLINYQGILVDPATGQPVPDDTYSITFSIYIEPSGGSAIWSESQNVDTKDGLYSVILGSITELIPTILSGPEKYLGIKVGSDAEMTPRRRIVSVAYAITSASVSGASNIFPSDGNVGIGTIAPTSLLDIMGGDAKINELTIGKGSGNVATNSAFGSKALYFNTTGEDNTANGYRALYYNTTGGDNTAIGFQALHFSTTGYCNTAIGFQALRANTDGDYNTANGMLALYYNTTGFQNTAIGSSALFENTTQTNNTAVGCSAGLYASSQGTFLGAFAGANVAGYSNVMGLGYQTIPTASNQVRIGNSSVTSIGGQVSWTAFSDGRYKLAVTENVKGLDFIMKLRPVTYQLDVNRLAADLKEDQRRDEQGNITTESSEIDIKARNEKSQIVYTGFVGQEVKQAAKEIGYDFSGVDAPKNENDFYGLRYAEFVVPLVKAVQEQQKMIEDMRNEITALKKRLGE